MSGPIVRKYGFPNFEKIFGERGLQHGAEEGEAGEPSTASETEKPATQAAKKGAKKSPPANKKAK